VEILPQPLELIGFIKKQLDELKPLLVKKNLKVIFKKHPKTLNINTDHTTFNNIVQTLLANAIEYTPQGGTINISLEKKDKFFHFVISDTGIGIPKKAQATIFNKFTRADNAKLVKASGSGLGLYIARRATELLDGKIWFESQEDKGTTFHVELPLESKSKKGRKGLA